jgi:hypothetical protein
MRDGFQLKVSSTLIGLEVVCERPLDVAGARVVPFDQVAVVGASGGRLGRSSNGYFQHSTVISRQSSQYWPIGWPIFWPVFES